jgi:hypothetical protein
MTELTQKAFMKGKRIFTLPGDGTVHCDFRYGRSAYQFSVDLSKLDETPRQDRFFATSMLVGTSILGIPSIGCLIGAILSDGSSDARIIFSVFCVLLSPFMLICILGFLKQSYRLLVFANPVNQQDSVVLFQGKPDPVQFEQFVSALRGGIATAHADAPKLGASIAAEVRELMKLREEGVLSDEEFQKAKTRVINGEANKEIQPTK